MSTDKPSAVTANENQDTRMIHVPRVRAVGSTSGGNCDTCHGNYRCRLATLLSKMKLEPQSSRDLLFVQLKPPPYLNDAGRK